MKKIALLVTLLFLCFSSSAFAATFFGIDPGLGEGTPLAAWPNATAAEANFLSNLVGVGTETFEGFAAGTGSPLALTFPGAGTATLTAPGGSIASVPAGSTNGFGRYGISPTNFWETGDTGFSITFSAPVAAFGFYGVDIGDFGGNVVVDPDSLPPFTLNVAGTPGGTVMFWGLIDTANPFTSITFSNTLSGVDFFAFDNMTIGSVEQVVPGEVPEPISLILLGSGLAGAGLYRKLRKPRG